MGIVNHDVNEFILLMESPGAQTIADDKDCAVVPCDGWIRAILARLDTAGVTGTQTTDVLLNGTSIFSGATLINFADGSKSPTYGALTTNPTRVSKGDTLRLNTTAIHSGTAGKSLAVAVTIRRGRASQQGFDADSISFNSDAV